MPKSLRKEILRKLFHLLEIPVLLFYSLMRFYWSDRAALLGLTVLFLVFLEVEYVRLEVRPKIPKEYNIFRARERDNVTGSIFFIAATIIVFAAFDYPIALTALLLTVFGDLTSALVGIKFGKHKLFRKKSWEGTLAGFLINLAVSALILPGYPFIFVPMALMASTVELLTGKLDDNLTVPIFAGFTGYLLAAAIQADLGGFPGPIEWLFKLF